MDTGLCIVNITNPTSPALPGNYALSGGGYGVAVSGAYAYVAGNTQLAIVDITIPAVPTLAGSIALPDGRSVAVAGSQVYVAASYGGV